MVFWKPTRIDPQQLELLLGLEDDRYITRPGASRFFVEETTTGHEVRMTRVITTIRIITEETANAKAIMIATSNGVGPRLSHPPCVLCLEHRLSQWLCRYCINSTCVHCTGLFCPNQLLQSMMRAFADFSCSESSDNCIYSHFALYPLFAP